MHAINDKTREIAMQSLLWLAIMAVAHLLLWSSLYFIVGLPPEKWYTISGAPWLLTIMAPAPFISIIYYYWLYKGYLSEKKYVAYILLLPLFAVLVVAMNLIYALPVLFKPDYFPENYRFLLTRVFQAIVAVDIPFILFYTAMRAARDMKKRRIVLEREQERTAVLLLNNQLEPHFLFNTLNAIYATAQKEQAAKTLAGVDELSALLRYATETANKEKVPLESELKFIEQYFFLRQMNAAAIGKSSMEQTISWDREPADISPMLLLPFAEIASTQHHPNTKNTVIIDIGNGALRMDILQYTASAEPDINRQLANTRKLLDVEYKNNYKLAATNNEKSRSISLFLNLKAKQ